MNHHDRRALHLMIRLLVLGYLSGVWWPSTRLEGLGILVLLGYLVHDFIIAPIRNRRNSDEERVPS